MSNRSAIYLLKTLPYAMFQNCGFLKPRLIFRIRPYSKPFYGQSWTFFRFVVISRYFVIFWFFLKHLISVMQSNLESLLPFFHLSINIQVPVRRGTRVNSQSKDGLLARIWNNFKQYKLHWIFLEHIQRFFDLKWNHAIWFFKNLPV